MRTLFLILSAAVLATFVPQAGAQAQAAIPAGKIRMVTRNLEPFSFDKDGRRVGYAA